MVTEHAARWSRGHSIPCLLHPEQPAVGSVCAQQVLLRGRVHTVRGKGKSAFIVLRQRTATVQVGM